MNNAYDDSDEEEYNIWTDGTVGGTFGGASGEDAMLKIDAAGFTPFNDVSVPHPEDEDYTEKQAVWITGSNENDENGDFTGYVDMIAYNIKFTGNDHGIPGCTDEVENDYYGTETGAPLTEECAQTDLTAEDNVKIVIGGDEWVITDIQTPDIGDCVLQDDLDRCSPASGSITLAKESDRRIMQLGDTMNLGNNYQLKLTDIGVAETIDNEHAALFDVIDTTTNDTVEASDIQKIFPGDTAEWTYPGTSDSVKVHVYKTTYGYELFQRWAEVAIRQEEWELKDGDTLDDPNDDWNVELVWKNKDPAAGTPQEDADALREIIFYATEYNDDPIELSPDDTLPVFKDEDTHYYTLTFNGMEDSEENDGLEFKIEKWGTNDWCDTGEGAADTTDRVKSATVLHVTSDYKKLNIETNLYDPSDNAADTDPPMVKEFVINLNGDATDIFDTTEDKGVAGEVYTKYETSSTSCWQRWHPAYDEGVDGAGTDDWNEAAGDDYALDVDYDYAGTDARMRFTLGDLVPTAAGAAANLPVTGFNEVKIEYRENAGEVTDAATEIGYDGLDAFVFYAQPDTGDGGTGTDALTDDWDFDANDDADRDDEELTYYGAYYDSDTLWDYDDATPGNHYTAPLPDSGTYDADFISDRGTVISSVTDSTVKLTVPSKILHVLWSFNTAEAAETADTTTWTGGEGDSTVVGGVTVTVDSIDETLSTCGVSAGGSATCTYNEDAVATINGQPSITVKEANPTAVNPSSLVILDKDAGSTASVISVGGEVVNTVTAQLLAGVEHNYDTGPVVQEVGGSIVVAGKEAPDTLQAAMDFINGLTES